MASEELLPQLKGPAKSFDRIPRAPDDDGRRRQPPIVVSVNVQLAVSA